MPEWILAFITIVVTVALCWLFFSMLLDSYTTDAREAGHKAGAIDHALNKVKVTADPREANKFHVIPMPPNQHHRPEDKWVGLVGSMDSL